MAEKKTVLSKVSKTLIKNVIRHTNTHNRMVEESEMWRQRSMETDSRKSENSFLKDKGLDMKYEFTARSRCQAHMDDEHQNTYWMKQLYKAEEGDTNRWGHSGFKQLYPEQFESSSSTSEEDNDRCRKRHKEYRSDREKEQRKKVKRHRKRKHSTSDLESDSDRESKKSKKKHKHKMKKKKRKHKKKDKKRTSESDSR